MGAPFLREPLTFVRLFWAFLRRDFLISVSYPLSSALTLVSGLVTLTLLHFLARTVGHNVLLTGRYGVDYFSFATVGLAAASAFSSFQTSFSRRVRDAQMDGSLEALLAAPRRTTTLLGMMASYAVASSLARSGGVLFFGWLFYRAQIQANPASLLLAWAMSALAFVPLGLISAAFVLTFKRGDPFAYLVEGATTLLCGFIYPVEVLPGWLQTASRFFPATHALAALRGAALKAKAPSEIAEPLALLALFSLLIWPVAIAALGWSRGHIEKSGTVGQF